MSHDIALVDFEELSVDVGHMRFALRAYGEKSNPVLITLHGWLDNAASFDRLAPLLSGFRVLSIDLAGHGLSSHRPDGVAYNIWDNVADVIAIADQLSLSNFSLLGHSMGGITATLLAGTFPDRIDQLLLIDGIWPMVNASSDAPAQLAKAIVGMQTLVDKRKTVYECPKQAIAARMKGMSPLSEPASAALVARGLERVTGGYSWSSDLRLRLPSMMRLNWDQARAFVANITAPTCVVLAEQGIYLRGSEFEKNRELLQRFTLHSMAGGHHLHMEEEAEQVAEVFNLFQHQHPTAGNNNDL